MSWFKIRKTREPENTVQDSSTEQAENIVSPAEVTPAPLHVATPVPPGPLGYEGTTPLSPLTHILVFSAILTPVALLPYLAVRRHLLSLHRKIGDLGSVNAALQRDLKTALVESAIRREEHDRLRAIIEESKRDIERIKMNESKRELDRVRVEERFRSSLDDLARDKQETRSVLSGLRDLGTSLADIAAFMQEVEIQQGFVSRKNDGRGIERIRQLAYKFQASLRPESDKSEVKVDANRSERPSRPSNTTRASQSESSLDSTIDEHWH